MMSITFGGYISDWNGNDLNLDSNGKVVASYDSNHHKTILGLLNEINYPSDLRKLTISELIAAVCLTLLYGKKSWKYQIQSKRSSLRIHK